MLARDFLSRSLRQQAQKSFARRGERGAEAISTSARRPEGDDYSPPIRTIARNSPEASGMTDKRDWRAS
jgi:hypothetical protein